MTEYTRADVERIAPAIARAIPARVRNDAQPAEREGYEPTGEGRYAECPDHGSRLWWHESRGVFYCPAERSSTGESLHAEEPYELAPQDVYLEHDEAQRVVNGCLWVDTYDEMGE